MFLIMFPICKVLFKSVFTVCGCVCALKPVGNVSASQRNPPTPLARKCLVLSQLFFVPGI